METMCSGNVSVSSCEHVNLPTLTAASILGTHTAKQNVSVHTRVQVSVWVCHIGDSCKSVLYFQILA